MSIKDSIALEITSHYSECNLPFAGTVLAWAKKNVVDSNGLCEWVNRLQDLKILGSMELVSLEVFGMNIDEGSIALGGFYPIATLPQDYADKAYMQASLLINTERKEKLVNTAYRRILAGALQTDQIGMIIAVLAEDADVANSMIQQAVSIILPSKSDEGN
jgi:hypothetical protein